MLDFIIQHRPLRATMAANVQAGAVPEKALGCHLAGNTELTRGYAALGTGCLRRAVGWRVDTTGAWRRAAWRHRWADTTKGIGHGSRHEARRGIMPCAVRRIKVRRINPGRPQPRALTCGTSRPPAIPRPRRARPVSAAPTHRHTTRNMPHRRHASGSTVTSTGALPVLR